MVSFSTTTVPEYGFDIDTKDSNKIRILFVQYSTMGMDAAVKHPCVIMPDGESASCKVDQSQGAAHITVNTATNAPITVSVAGPPD